ncbi:MAG: hypothetical protein QNK42_07900 [Pseudodonghicola sp.]|nr:hypothetical protein [Pseudodonghicola sp.]
MSRLRLIGLTGGTLACALGIGYGMQRGQPAPLPHSTPAVSPAEANMPAAEPRQTDPAPARVRLAENAPLEIEKIALTSAEAVGASADNEMHEHPSVSELATDPSDSAALPSTPEDPEMPGLGCEVTAQAVPGPMAMVDFSVTAPCFGNTRLLVHHNGMIFSAVTDSEGSLNVKIPALAERAVFIAAFDNGDGAVATARVPGIADFDRVALQWQGNAGFQIHAREFGASYGAPGHVWSGAPTTGATDHATGSVLRLGEADALSPMIAEIYTFPAGAADRSGDISLSIEAEVTADNCGRDISAQLLQRQGANRITTRELDLSVPDCDAVGDFLVLNNLLDDLKIAAK